MGCGGGGGGRDGGEREGWREGKREVERKRDITVVVLHLRQSPSPYTAVLPGRRSCQEEGCRCSAVEPPIS